MTATDLLGRMLGACFDYPEAEGPDYDRFLVAADAAAEAGDEALEAFLRWAVVGPAPERRGERLRPYCGLDRDTGYWWWVNAPYATKHAGSPFHNHVPRNLWERMTGRSGVSDYSHLHSAAAAEVWEALAAAWRLEYARGWRP